MFGDRISIRDLAKDSGVPRKTLERWSTQDSWTTRRGQYNSQTRAKVEEKTINRIIEKTSDKVSDEIASVQAEHAENYRAFRDLVMLKVKYIVRQCNQDQPLERFEAQLEKLNGLSLNFLSLVLDRSVKGERTALGLKYSDYNTAIEVLTSAGFEVIVPEGMEELNQVVNRLTQLRDATIEQQVEMEACNGE